MTECKKLKPNYFQDQNLTSINIQWQLSGLIFLSGHLLFAHSIQDLLLKKKNRFVCHMLT